MKPRAPLLVSYLLLAITLMVLLPSSCRPGNVQELVSDPVFHSLYDSLVYHGERYVLKSEFEKASDSYLKACNSKYRYPKSKDMYNGLIAAVRSEKYTSAVSFLKVLVRQGFQIKTLNKREEFSAFASSSAYQDYVTHSLEEDLVVFQSTFMEDLYLNIQNLVLIDQKEYCGIDGLSPQLTDSISTVFYEYLEDQKLLPSEQVLGCCHSDKRIPQQLPMYNPLLIHAAQNDIEYFTEIIINSVKEGVISPDYAYYILGFATNIEVPHCLMVKVDDKKYTKILTESELQNDIRVREKIGLYPLKHTLSRNLNQDSSFLFIRSMCGYAQLSEYNRQIYTEI